MYVISQSRKLRLITQALFIKETIVLVLIDKLKIATYPVY